MKSAGLRAGEMLFTQDDTRAPLPVFGPNQSEDRSRYLSPGPQEYFFFGHQQVHEV
jgi:hypothetical protein